MMSCLRRGVDIVGGCDPESAGGVKKCTSLRECANEMVVEVVHLDTVFSGVPRDSDSRLTRVNGPGSLRPPGTDPEIGRGIRSMWKFAEEHGCHIELDVANEVPPIEVESREQAMAMVLENPHWYFGCQWVIDDQGENAAMVFPRACKFFRGGVQSESLALWSSLLAYYQQLDTSVTADEPEVELATFNGSKHSWRCPGRLQGMCDVPGLTVVGDIDPFDISQGMVADQWLLAAFASLAEFGAEVIKGLFRNTRCLDELPVNGLNRYVVTLYDLRTWQPVDVTVDEQLPWDEAKWCPVGCRPTRSGELWPCILEKAVAKLCGGWDELHGGSVVHGWRLLLGCRDVYTITRVQGDRYGSFGNFNLNKTRRDGLSNSPKAQWQEGSGPRLFPMRWPEVGGGGGPFTQISGHQLFKKMCAWDDANYLMCALRVTATEHGRTFGVTYTIRHVLCNPASGYDLIQMRAHRGIEQIQSEGWCYGGPKWKEHQDLYWECGEPGARDDGLFWLERGEFFRHFKTIYICAQNLEYVQMDRLCDTAFESQA